jgi:hypothetical protein
MQGSFILGQTKSENIMGTPKKMRNKEEEEARMSMTEWKPNMTA